MEQYAKSCNFFAFIYSRTNRLWLPKMGLNSFHPVFLSLSGNARFDRIQVRQGMTWYENWLEKIFTFTPQGIAEDAYKMAINHLEKYGLILRFQDDQNSSVGLNPEALNIVVEPTQLFSQQGQYWLNVPEDAAENLLGMPCLDGDEEYQKIRQRDSATSERLKRANQGRVFAAEHTGLLERKPREDLEKRFKSREPKPWYENLLSATPTLEMGVDIGDLSSIMLCSVPPNQASYLQRIGCRQAGWECFYLNPCRGNSAHDQYFS